MQFVPKKFKYKKQKKGKLKNLIQKSILLNKLKFGNIGLVSIKTGRLTSKHFEILKIQINKYIKKIGKLKFNLFPQQTITRKPIEMRMGKGKGNVSTWITKVGIGTIVCEIQASNLLIAKRALINVKYKLPFECKLIF